MSYCKLIVNGRITRDLELRTTPNGTHVCDIGIAYDTGWGQNRKSSFLDCVCFGKTAEFVSKWFAKGDGILLDGTLEMDSWEDKNTGQKRSKHRMVIDRATFADAKRNAGGGAGPDSEPAAAAASSPANDGAAGNWDAGNDDDIPF